MCMQSCSIDNWYSMATTGTLSYNRAYKIAEMNRNESRSIMKKREKGGKYRLFNSCDGYMKILMQQDLIITLFRCSEMSRYFVYFILETSLAGRLSIYNIEGMMK